MPRLEWLQTNSAGIGVYLAPGVLPEGCAISSATGAFGQAVSEHAITLMLALMKNLPRYRDNQRDGAWRDEGMALSPVGATALIIGTGDLGSSIGTTCVALGARTVGVRRDPSKPAAGIGEMHGFDELDALIPTADVIMVCVPGTPETRGLIDAVRLEAMRRSAILVDVGRGSVIDTDALARALATGEIRGAAIDVTDPEPLPAGHPLWSEPRCLITPHVAGGNHLADVPKRIFEIAVANLRRYAKGELPGNPVH